MTNYRARYTQEEIITKFIEAHGTNYNYSRVCFTKCSSKVEIVCEQHGSFMQAPASHMRGAGCSECRRNKLSGLFRKTLEDFIEEANKRHNNKYDYSLVEYKNSRKKIRIICPFHGEFIQIPADHMKSVHGCYDCAREYIKTNQTFTTDDFIRIATARHKGKYDYSESNYTTAKGKVKILCKEHGYFEQDAFSHMKGSSCRPCVNDVMFNQRKADKAHFIKRAEKRHGDRYDYSKVEYVNAKTRVIIICKEHGEFTAIPDNHWTSGGICPDCDDYKSGYDRNKFGIFYVISADNLIKVGITNNQPHSRLKSVSESSGLVFNTVKHFEHKDGSLINELENIMLKKLRSNYQQPTYKFDGYTESFFDVDVQSLLLDIEVEFNILKESYGKIKTEERET